MQLHHPSNGAQIRFLFIDVPLMWYTVCSRLWEMGGLLKSCIRWVPASTISPSAICYSRPIKCIWWHSRTFWALNQLWSADPLSNHTMHSPPPHYDVMSWLWPKVFGTWDQEIMFWPEKSPVSVSAFRLELSSTHMEELLWNICPFKSLGPETQAKRLSFDQSEFGPSVRVSGTLVEYLYIL